MIVLKPSTLEKNGNLFIQQFFEKSNMIGCKPSVIRVQTHR